MVLGWLLYVICFILFVWVLLLTIYVVKVIKHYNNLTQGVSNTNLKEVLEVIIKQKKLLQAQNEELSKKVATLEQLNNYNLQRIGIIRFNPFSDTGGSQSFSLALLDGKNNGLIITSLYARTGNRWYIKYVKNGQGKDLELSKEEKQAIQNAIQISNEKG